MFEGVGQKSAIALLDRAARWQAPMAARYVDRLRRMYPADTADRLARRLERRYLWTVTASGVAVGVIAAVPGVGTLAGLVATGIEAAFFLDVSALFTIATAAAYGVAPDKRHRRELVLGVVLGEGGMGLAEKNAAGSARNWSGWLADRIPGLRRMDDSFAKRYLVQFLAKRGVLIFGRVLPAGLGAIIGGVGNRALGRVVIANARSAVERAALGDSADPALESVSRQHDSAASDSV
ncbi:MULTISPECIES: hypothetical protein [unclassified Nocardia]|uniref:hypothetical protein n=1 Tax=unclassified Nocardia TaxID=2637762 RepID=UPI001CE3D4BF|nr:MULTISPECIES: hypothetical protein [unclassified Nocardia]